MNDTLNKQLVSISATIVFWYYIFILSVFKILPSRVYEYAKDFDEIYKKKLDEQVQEYAETFKISENVDNDETISQTSLPLSSSEIV